MRPKALIVVAGFLFAATAIAVAVGLALLFPGGFLEWLGQFNPRAIDGFRAWNRLSGALLIALGAATAITACGLLKSRKWAWWLAVALFAINGGGDVVSYFITRDALRSVSGVFICAAFLYALIRVRRSAT